LELVALSALATTFYDSFHVASFCSYQSPGHLELFIILNLNVKSAGVLSIIIETISLFELHRREYVLMVELAIVELTILCLLLTRCLFDPLDFQSRAQFSKLVVVK